MTYNTNIKILYQNDKELPKLIYTSEVFANIKNLMNTKHAQTQEFGFMGEIERDGVDYIVTKLHILPQKTTSAYFETDDDKYPEWLGETFPNVKDRKKLRLQAHSHVNMSTNPSGVDDTQIRKMIDGVKDYFIQLIINHKMENTINLYSKEQNLIYTNLKDYVKIGNILIPVNKQFELDIKEYTKNITPEFVKDLNLIYLTDDIYFDTQYLKTYITDKNIIYDVTDKSFILTKTSEKDLDKEINKMITNKTSYLYPYACLYDQYYESDENYLKQEYVKKGNKKNEPKQTSRVLQSSRKNK